MFRDRHAREPPSPKNDRRSRGYHSRGRATVAAVVGKPQASAVVIAGPGPRWFRYALMGMAGIYLLCLLKHPPDSWQPLAYFSQCTRLFPEADKVALEFRLEAWSCGQRRWVPLDPRPYFPIEADDKESRFQRFGYFYADRGTADERRPMLTALDEYIMRRHPSVDDGVPDAIGGIRLYKWTRPLPEPGEHVDRYVFRPFSPVPADQRQNLYNTRASVRKQRCGTELPPEEP